MTKDKEAIVADLLDSIANSLNTSGLSVLEVLGLLSTVSHTYIAETLEEGIKLQKELD